MKMAGPKEKTSLPRKPKSKAGSDGKVHPWRKCPLGKHLRLEHEIRPHMREGRPVRGSHQGTTCQKNESEKDTIYPVEIDAIAHEYFSTLSGPPKGDDLSDLRYEHGNDFDIFIRGWAKYWNEVLQPSEPLDPNLVKALIASESSFGANKTTKDGKGQGRARGLMQVTDTSRAILAATEGELKDHLVVIKSAKDILAPNLNIIAGIRWLFRKKEIAESRAKSADWIKTVALYKGYPENHSQMTKFKKNI